MLQWQGKQFEQFLRSASDAGIKRAATFYHRKCIEKVSKPNTGRRVRRVRGKGSYTIYPNPSKPGEAPKLRTGFGRRNIVANHGEGYSRVGITANARYMIFLELGTRKIARRPWLIQTLTENKDTIGALAVAGQ